jgi:hypothetical protein
VSEAGRSDENDPKRPLSEGRADTVALATEQCAPVLMKGRRRLRRLIYDDVKLVRDTIQRLGARTAPPGAVYIGRGSPYGNPFARSYRGKLDVRKTATHCKTTRNFRDRNPNTYRRVTGHKGGKAVALSDE